MKKNQDLTKYENRSEGSHEEDEKEISTKWYICGMFFIIDEYLQLTRSLVQQPLILLTNTDQNPNPLALS